jgi:hypothetical protein
MGDSGEVVKGWRTVSFQAESYWDGPKEKKVSVNLDHRLGEAWAYFLQERLTVGFWAAPREQGYRPKSTLRCQVNGASVGVVREDPMDEDAHNSATDSRTHVYVGYQNYTLHTSFTKQTLSEHPGAWSCSLNLNGKPSRAFKFKVGEGGDLEKHALQAADNGALVAREGVTLLDVSILGDFDRPGAKANAGKGAFFGRGLK